MWITNVCTRVKPKVEVPWHWNSANYATMLLPKDVSSNFKSSRSVTCYSYAAGYVYVKSSQHDKLV